VTQTAVILAAGMGTRLGRPWPKPLTPLADGRTIMRQQVDNLTSAFGDELRIMTVIGFKLELIIESFPNNLYVYNESYDQTNTNRSLLKALKLSGPGGVLWMNGDVVFDPRVLDRVKEYIDRDESIICVNTAVVGDEEVKYRVDADGFVNELSKQVVNALGESVGINFVAKKDKELLISGLEACQDSDYFERGIEIMVDLHGSHVRPVDISDLFAVEVDFEEAFATGIMTELGEPEFVHVAPGVTPIDYQPPLHQLAPTGTRRLQGHDEARLTAGH
jgi:choline kinase